MKHNNSLYCAEPPRVIIPNIPNPNEEMDWKIMEHLDQEKYDNGFVDIDEAQIRELIKNGKNETIRQPI